MYNKLKCLLIIAILIFNQSAFAAVALGVAGATAQNGAATTLSTASFTTGAGVTGLLCALTIASGTAPTGVTMKWNTSTSMTQISSTVITVSNSSTIYTFYFGLANPALTTSTCTGAWTNAGSAYISAISFTGTDNTTPFLNLTSKTNQTGGSPSLTVTVPSGGAGVVVFVNADSNDWGSEVSGTSVTAWFDQNADIQNQKGGYNIGVVNPTYTATSAGTSIWGAVGVAVQPPTGGGPTCMHALSLFGAGC